jgi:hypothetical protein
MSVKRLSLILVVAALVLTEAAHAQKGSDPGSTLPPVEISAADFAANCREAAIAQGSRVRPETEFHAAMMEQATYWTDRLETLVPDTASRNALVAAAHASLLGRLRSTGYLEGMTLVGEMLAQCRVERDQLLSGQE